VFERFRTDGRRFRHGVLWCSWVDDEAATPPGVAYALGRGLGGAVVRNRVRRRLRALLADEARARPLPSGYYLLGATPEAASATFDALRVDLRGLFARIEAAVHG
jgi:ribonuclease P protein component